MEKFFEPYTDKNFLYLNNYLANKENLTDLAKFIDDNDFFLFWKDYTTNSWIVSGKKPYNVFCYRRIHIYFGEGNTSNLVEVSKSYYILEIIYETCKKYNFNNCVFLYSLLLNNNLDIYFSGIVSFNGKIGIGCNIYDIQQISNFIDFTTSLDLDFSFHIKDHYYLKKVQYIVNYLLEERIKWL